MAATIVEPVTSVRGIELGPDCQLYSRRSTIPPHLVAAVGSGISKPLKTPIEKKPRPSGYKLFIFCVIDFLIFVSISDLVCALLFCVLCACTFFQVLVSGSSAVLQTALGEHGRKEYKEASSADGGHPGI